MSVDGGAAGGRTGVPRGTAGIAAAPLPPPDAETTTAERDGPVAGTDRWHLAQVNVARLVAPLDDPAVSEFVAGLGPVNALADTAPGFVWRLQTDGGDATAVRVVDDPLVIVNLSVWTSLETLSAFTFRSDHAGYLRRRRTWFTPLGTAPSALWWVPAGHLPDVTEALARLASLDADGPNEQAFTFARPFPPPA